MIYLLDSHLSKTSHSQYIIDIIKEHTDTSIELITISNNITYGEIANIVISLFEKVIPNDIVLCPWAVPANKSLDELFTELSTLCYVVAAAGNFKKPVEDYTPAGSDGVITVGTLNKSGLIAALSNYSNNKEIIWLPGTNYTVGWKNSSGTSVSAALYAAFLAEGIKHKDMTLVEKMIEEQKTKVFNELNGLPNLLS